MTNCEKDFGEGMSIFACDFQYLGNYIIGVYVHTLKPNNTLGCCTLYSQKYIHALLGALLFFCVCRRLEGSLTAEVNKGIRQE